MKHKDLSMTLNTTEGLKQSILKHLRYTRVKDRHNANPFDYYYSLALAIRDRVIDSWADTQTTFYQRDTKRVYYLSF